MNFKKALILIASFLSLAACMKTVETQVDAYSSIPADLEPKTVYVAPYAGMNGNSLEWQTNAQILANVLNEKGFTVVGRQRDARLTAYFGFGIDRGERVQTAYSVPQWGVTGYSGANTYGTLYGNTYSATTTLNPTYGVTGYSTGTSTSIVYTRSVSIDMFDNKNREQVFQAKAISRGSCNSLAPVAPYIITSVLTNFPEGKTGTVNLAAELEC